MAWAQIAAAVILALLMIAILVSLWRDRRRLETIRAEFAESGWDEHCTDALSLANDRGPSAQAPHEYGEAMITTTTSTVRQVWPPIGEPK